MARKLLVILLVVLIAVGAYVFLTNASLFYCHNGCAASFSQPLPQGSSTDMMVVTGGQGNYVVTISPQNNTNPATLIFRVTVTNTGTTQLDGLYFQFKNSRDGSTWKSTGASETGSNAVITSILVSVVRGGAVQGQATTFNLGPTSVNGGFDRMDFQFTLYTNLPPGTATAPKTSLLGYMTVINAPSADALQFNAP